MRRKRIRTIENVLLQIYYQFSRLKQTREGLRERTRARKPKTHRGLFYQRFKQEGKTKSSSPCLPRFRPRSRRRALRQYISRWIIPIPYRANPLIYRNDQTHAANLRMQFQGRYLRRKSPRVFRRSNWIPLNRF